MSVVAYIRLVRPVNTVVTGLVVIVGGLLAATSNGIDLQELILAALSALLVASGGNALNDAYDSVIDKINRPSRPIPSGSTTVARAATTGVLSMSTGTALGFVLSIPLGFLAAAVSLMLWAYNSVLKRRALTGNLTVAICGGLAFVYGAVAVGNVAGGIVPAVFAFLVQLARELVKDCEDVEGDRAVNARTLPIRIGVPATLRWTATVLVLLILATWIPYFFDLYGKLYLVLINVLANVPLVVLIVFLIKGARTDRLGTVSTSLKAVMLTGLLSLYLAV